MNRETAFERLRAALIPGLITLLLGACAEEPPLQVAQRLPTVDNTQLGFYVQLKPLRKAPPGLPVKTQFIPILTDWRSTNNNRVFATSLWIVAADPHCKASMMGKKKVSFEITDRSVPAHRWLMEVTQGSTGIFTVTRTEGTFYANPKDDDAKLPEKGWPNPP